MTDIIPLAKLRDQIDSIDEQILRLINQRADCAMEVARTKLAEGETGTFYRPDREALVLRRIKALNQGPLSDQVAAGFFRELMSACLALEKPLKVAFLGPEGTFTQQATFKHFGQSVKTIPISSIYGIFTEVEKQHCQFGVVPVENSTGGVIAHTFDRFISSPLKICGEVECEIHHNLIGNVDDLSCVKVVISHPQSLVQCRQWLTEHLPGVKHQAAGSNAEAAKRVMGCHDKVAIAGEVAARLYQLDILARNIEDESNNTTRFIIIGQQEPVATNDDKTSLMVSTSNRSGSLYQILQPFAEHGISLSHIESRPSKQGLWDYVFFIDVNGHQQDEKLAKALDQLSQSVNLLNILGSYPRAVL